MHNKLRKFTMVRAVKCFERLGKITLEQFKILTWNFEGLFILLISCDWPSFLEKYFLVVEIFWKIWRIFAIWKKCLVFFPYLLKYCMGQTFLPHVRNIQSKLQLADTPKGRQLWEADRFFPPEFRAYITKRSKRRTAPISGHQVEFPMVSAN